MGVSDIDTVFTQAKFADGSYSTIAVSGGFIASITSGSDPAPAAAETIDLAGTLVIPSFVEGHIHLDTSFYGDVWRSHVPYSNGFNVQERVAIQADNMAKAAPMAERAKSQLELCLGHGSTRMRSHVMVDGSVGLKSLETILAVREAHRDVMDIQLVAFPQSGILRSPGTPDLLDAAFDLGDPEH
jgi:cytosine/creatinine deaminase